MPQGRQTGAEEWGLALRKPGGIQIKGLGISGVREGAVELTWNFQEKGFPWHHRSPELKEIKSAARGLGLPHTSTGILDKSLCISALWCLQLQN